MRRLRHLSSATAATLAASLLAVVGAAASVAIITHALPAHRSVVHAPRVKPSLRATFPAAGGFVGAARWRRGCPRGPGICGTVSVAPGSSAVLVAIQRNSGRRYWNGHAYKSHTPLYRRAALSALHGLGNRPKQLSWLYRLALPHRDGGYTIRLEAVSRVRKRNRVLLKRTVRFTVDTVAPRPPAITSAPANPTSATTASFGFSTREGHVSFMCRFDGGLMRACSSPSGYPSVGLGAHYFRVAAVDRAGNVSAPSGYAWSVTATGAASKAGGSPGPFTISGDATGALFPGGPARPIGLTVSNPGDSAIVVTTLTTSLLEASLPSGCSAANYRITQASLPADGIPVPAHSSVTLPTNGAAAPTIQLLDVPVDQDACAGARLTLLYNGSARS